MKKFWKRSQTNKGTPTAETTTESVGQDSAVRDTAGGGAGEFQVLDAPTAPSEEKPRTGYLESTTNDNNNDNNDNDNNNN